MFVWAGMAELADAADLKSAARESLWVRVPLPAPGIKKMAWLIVLLAYFIGAVPTAYIAGRLVVRQDIRRMGDANMGAANAYRELGPGIGLIVFFIDAAKGALVIFIAQLVNLPQIGVLLVGVAVVVGHNWPVYLGFRGGRGESTTIGILLILVTLPMLIMAVPALITLYLKKNVTLASAVLFVPLSLLGWWLHLPGVIIAYSIGLPCLVGFTHFLRTRKQVIPG